MELELPVVRCPDCEGGWVGVGGPGGHRCNSCGGTGKRCKVFFTAQEIAAALQENFGYTPSGNHVIREITRELGFKERNRPDTEFLSNPPTFRKVSRTLLREG